MFVGSRSLARLVLASVATMLAIASACSGESPASSSGNSNTNWLRSCNTRADCGTALACVCGLCTLACGSQTDCASLGGAATCATSPMPMTCHVDGLCLRRETPPDASLESGGSSGMGMGGGGAGATTGGAAGQPSTGGRGTGGGSSGGMMQTAGGRGGGAGNGASSGAGGSPLRDAEADGNVTVKECHGQVCHCASGAYCLVGGALCIVPTSPCPLDDRLPGCSPPCAAGSVCVRRQTVGGALFAPDGGRCPAGRLIVPEAPSACSTLPSFTCEAVSPGCTGTPTCGCTGSLCTSPNLCDDNIPGQIDCIARVP